MVYFVANLWMISAFLFGLFGKWASAFERLRCCVCFEARSLWRWRETFVYAEFTRSCLVFSWSFCIFCLFSKSFFKILFSNSTSKRSLSPKINQNIFFAFSRWSLHFSVFVRPEYSPLGTLHLWRPHGRGWRGLEICHLFIILILNNRCCSSLWMRRKGVTKLVIFVDFINVWPPTWTSQCKKKLKLVYITLGNNSN